MSGSVNEFEPEDTRYWKLKGQGNANAVFAYAPDVVKVPSEYHEHLRNKASKIKDSYAQHIIRVRKEKLPEIAHLKTSIPLERAIWDNIVTNWGPGGAAQEQYENRVLRLLLGGEHIYQGQHVRLPVAFTTALAFTHGLRLSQDAWIVRDHTVFKQPSALNSGHRSRTLSCPMPTICLELKPKCGFLPTSPCINPEHSIKLRVPRFQLHQQLKLAQGKVQKRSAYNPLDLFSGHSLQMQKALKDLLACPQNNLRIFVDGEPLAEDGIEGKLSEVSTPHGGLARLLSTITVILQRTGVLMKVLRVQKLDLYDVEGIKALLDHLLTRRCQAGSNSLDLPSGPDMAGSCTKAPEIACDDSLHQQQREAIQDLLRLDRAAAFHAIRDYLTAATAKDLSIMITLRRTSCHITAGQLVDAAGGHVALMEGHDPDAHVLTDGVHATEYKVALVDLDMKPLRKVFEHWRLDKDIMHTVSGLTVPNQGVICNRM